MKVYNLATDLTPENAANALKIINVRHPDRGEQTFRYQGRPVPYKKNKYNHLYGPYYDTKVLYEREFKHWAVVLFKTPEMLEAFKIFQASKTTLTIAEHLKKYQVEDEAELFENVEAVHSYEYDDETF